MKKNFKEITIFIALLFVVSFSFKQTFAQCDGTYFKTDYRKIIGKVPVYTIYQLEDWTGDGKLDFWKFELDANTSAQKVVVYPNNGGGWNWDNPVIYNTTIGSFGNSFGAYTIFDFDSDGDKDIYDRGTVHRNNGNGTFTALATNSFLEKQFIQTIGYVDINNDNYLDWVNVVGVPNQGNSIGYRLGKADGTFGERVNLITSISIISKFKILADFTGDGKIDLAYGYSNSYRVLINTGNGNFTPGPENSASNLKGSLLAKDLNNDGKADLVSSYTEDISGSPKRFLFNFKSNGDGTFGGTELPIFHISHINSFAYCADCAQVRIVELNGDNSPDLIEIGESFYSVHLNDGAGNFTRTDYLIPLTNSVNNLIFFDYDGDGRDDIYDRGQSGYNIFDEFFIVIRRNVCQKVGETRKANFDKSYFPDIVMWNPNTGEWASKNAHWVFTYSAIKKFKWGSGALGDVPAPGDFDADGTTDYAVYRNGEGNWYILRSSDSSWLTVKFGLPGDVPVPNDYDGGGRTDIAVFRPSDGTWYIWLTETQQFYAVRFGANGDKPVPADYDGDGRTDVAVFRPSEGNWYYMRSSDQNFVAVNWGINSDKPVPADYDGDGKADIAVYRSSGDWYILRSHNNSFNYFKWGTTGDIPAPIYANHGESAYVVVYRPGNRTWYNYSAPNSGIGVGNNDQSVPVYFGLPNN